jgi:hypothetical protein
MWLATDGRYTKGNKMSQKALVACTVVVVLGSMTLFAGDSGKGSGYFTNHFNDVTVSEMPDGSMVQLIHYSNMSIADDSHHPSADTAAECVGALRMNADGAVTSGSGSCFVEAEDGQGFSYWWQVEKAGTADCPELCGVWSYFGGYGRFAGLEGTGTWKVTASFGQAGSMGTWTNTYSMP